MFLGELPLYCSVVLPPKIDIDIAGLSVADLKQRSALRQLRVQFAVHVGKVIRVLGRSHSTALVRSNFPNHVRHVGERYERLLAQAGHSLFVDILHLIGNPFQVGSH